MAVHTTAPPLLIITAILDGISVLDTELGMYITCWLVWRGARRAIRAGHDVAGPSINMDLSEAEVRCEAGLGGAAADVAAHSCQIEKQPAT
jgi:hypothetical protein